MPSGQVSAEAQELLDAYKKAFELERDYNSSEEDKIAVHQVSSKLAFLYEKVRNTVDYKEEHLLRKNAVGRILKRRIMTERNEYDVAKFLVYELIRARYLPNKTIPEKRIDEVKVIIEKYTYLLNKIPDYSTPINDKENVFDWIIGIASYEIEEKLVPHGQETAIVDFARKAMEKKIKVREELRIDQGLEKELTYIAVLKNLIKSDMDMIRYRVFLMKHPDWLFAPSEDKFAKMALVMNSIATGIDATIHHRYADNFSRAVKKNLAYFEILQEVAASHPKEMENIFSHHFHVEDAIKETCVRKYRNAQAKLRRSATRSIVYIFITKVFIALLIEYPYERYILGEVNVIALGINIVFPPILMALVVMSISVPSKKNTALIVAGISEMIYDNYAQPPLVIKGNVQRNSLFLTVFQLFYLIVFGISFGFIFYILGKLGFNYVSMGIFVFFVSVVSYFGIRIRQNARELLVIQEEGVAGFLAELFMMPLMKVGQWLSVKMAKINVFAYILDFIIEAPFKTFVEIFESWIYYVKEERDKIE